MLYAGALTFLLNPIYPVIDSAHLIEFVAGMSRYETYSRKSSAEIRASPETGLPGWLKMSIKAIVSVPFTFHSFNGLRHLMWDMGYGESVGQSFAKCYRVDPET